MQTKTSSLYYNIVRMKQSEYPSEVLDGFLYLGDSVHGTSEDKLKELGITRVVNVTKTDYTNKFKNPSEFHFHFCKLEDHPNADIYQVFIRSAPYLTNVLKFFHDSSSFIEEAESLKEKVLVHCEEGMSRSPTITIAYLMKCKKMCLKDALLLVKKKRPRIDPNNGFVKQLIRLEKELYNSTSMDESLFEDEWGFGCYTFFIADLKKQQESQK
jgi:protein-tyrosine phosphatase